MAIHRKRTTPQKRLLERPLFVPLAFEVHGGGDGHLVALEALSDVVPFAIKRVYYIFDVAVGLRRGFHAHKKLKQILVCLSGSCDVLLDDGRRREVVNLSRPSVGVLIDHPVWREIYNFSKDCVLLVIASEPYDPDDYIKDYRQFRRFVNK